ncbi:MAG: enolase C-terminal domain-like protein [Thermoproteota archaeon]
MSLQLEYHKDPFRVPLKFGAVVVSESTSLIIRALVKTRDGREGEGIGSMPLVYEWAFPDPAVPPEKKLQAMCLISERFCKFLERWQKFGHPIDIFMKNKPKIRQIARQVSDEAGLKVPMSILGALVAVSPIDAAIHDAFGHANMISSYEGCGPGYMERDLSYYLGRRFRGKYITDYIRRSFSKELPVFHLVGGLDKLRREEVDSSDPRDGFPVSLDDWIRHDGIFCFKVKLRGNDIEWDVRRTKEVAEVASETLEEIGRKNFYLSADSNEMNPSPDSTLEYLRRLKKASPLAFSRLLYIEQPTERDLRRHMYRMEDVAKVKPVLADEGIVDLETFDLALKLGWSGPAVKTCKGHSSSLLYIAKAEELGIPYSIQDLTCPGLALVHSASLAARTRPIKGFEYNSRQYLPLAFPEVRERHKDLFTVKDGKVRTTSLTKIGLGLR